MKKPWISLILPLILLALSGQSYARPTSPELSGSADGYWKRVSVEIEKAPDGADRKATLNRGAGTFRSTYATPAGNGVFGTSYSWTEPGERYNAGQSVNLTLSIKITEYFWLSKGPADSNDFIMAGFHGGGIFSDANNIREASVFCYEGDIVDRSGSVTVSDKFPQGTKGQQLSLYVHCDGAGIVNYTYEWVGSPVADPAGEERVVREGSYWELTSVEIKKCPDSQNSEYTMDKGSGTFRTFDNDEVFQFSFTFTEPGKLIYAGQDVRISLTIKIDEYRWKGQFNNMGGKIEAGFLPGVPFRNSDDPAIWFAGVHAAQGEIIDRRDAVVLTGKFPAPYPNGKATFYIKTDHCQTILYHYKCTFVE